MGAAGSSKRCLVLVMRKGFRSRVDHIQAMLDLAVEIHLVTQEPEEVANDPRFASYVRLPRGAVISELFDTIVQVVQLKGRHQLLHLMKRILLLPRRQMREWGSTGIRKKPPVSVETRPASVSS